MTANLKKGFTLIELLIVMAILGVLAVVVLVAINPAEQLARTRDTGRVSAVTQMGHAVQAYYTSQNAAYPAAATWSTVLTGSGELSIVPALIKSTLDTYCGTNVVNGWCYAVSGTPPTEVIVYSRLESKNYGSKCTGAGELAYALFSASLGRGGVVCSSTGDVAASAATPPTYVFK